METAFAYTNRIIVEPMVQNLREINCSLLGDYEDVTASVCEEPLRGARVLTFDDKYTQGKTGTGMGGAKRRIPADIGDDLTRQVQDLARRAFLAIQASGVARVDFLHDEVSGELYVNEINTIPGSLAFYLWEHSGVSFTELTERLIRLALKRQREAAEVNSTIATNILAMAGKGASKAGSKR